MPDRCPIRAQIFHHHLMKCIDFEFERQDNEKKCKAWLSLDGRTSLPDLGCLSVPGKRLELNRPPPNEHISKVYGLSRFRKCLLCPLAQKLVETQDLSVALPQWWLCGGARGPAAFLLSPLCAKCRWRGARQYPSAPPAIIDHRGG